MDYKGSGRGLGEKGSKIRAREDSSGGGYDSHVWKYHNETY
jgi:hypothetical protein